MVNCGNVIFSLGETIDNCKVEYGEPLQIEREDIFFSFPITNYQNILATKDGWFQLSEKLS